MARTRMPCSLRWMSAASAERSAASGKRTRTKFAALGQGCRESAARRSLSQASQRALCRRERSTCSRSPSAATPAACAAWLTLNGPRTRFSTSATAGGQ